MVNQEPHTARERDNNDQMDAEPSPLSEALQPPPTALIGVFLPEIEEHPLMEESAWLALRDSVLVPDEVTELVTSVEGRREFLTGARLMGLIGGPGGAQPKPQQLLVADMLAAGRSVNGILMPRRSTKTSSILAVLIGRCACRPRRNSAFTLATTGLKAREKFATEVLDVIEETYPDPRSRPVKIVRQAGSEALKFPNRSVLAVHAPIGDNFRSSAYDDVLVDEAGRAKEAMTDDLLAAIPPTLDTTGGQMIVSGTADDIRTGNLLWDVIATKRDLLGAGVLRYSAPDSTTDEELEDWEPSEARPEARVRELVELHHPGIGNLTPLEAVRKNFILQPRVKFIREYLGIFGEEGASTALFDPLKWARTGSDEDPGRVAMPERWSLAFAPHPDQLCVSIVAAWREEDGRAVPLMLDRIQGIDKAAPALLRLWRRHKVPIVYDAGSQVAQLIAEALSRTTPRPKLEPRAFMDVKKAASLIVDEVDRENVLHYSRQVEFNEAIFRAVKRKSGDRGWLVGRDPKKPDEDVTGVEAWALAQLHYDTSKPRKRTRMQVAA